MKTNNISSKMWGKDIFWGLGYEFDPQWTLTKRQKELQNNLIIICKEIIRPQAIECDKNLTFPKESFNALSKLGLLGLTIPIELGGLGENHTCAAMIVETIARYGCPSTAMCYVMHIAALSALLLHASNNSTFKNLLSRINNEVLIGTIAYSDPSTGSHAWFPKSSNSQETKNGWKVFKKASWVTSGGFADWYLIQTTSHEFQGDYSKLSCYLLFQNEVTTNPSIWKGLGMRGNQSGPLEVDGIEIPKDRIVGKPNEASKTNNESPDIFYLLCSSACWNGVAMGLIDLGTKHTTKKKHEDIGMRIADYPSIQDYFGEMIAETNNCRLNCFFLADILDKKTDNCNWNLYDNDNFYPRSEMMTWFWQLKLNCTTNVSNNSDKVLHACGGSGYKPELEVERYLRDAKAGWIMAPTNEVLKQLIGKLALLGPESLDAWNQKVNETVLNNEINKMGKDKMREFGEFLIKKALS
ncbi:acyl-CoA/acyl-ACP dehydrogenase [Pigmentibacter sp. JX0631]|uniref:acyl-CoA dehydrogenase family protein n=1 Tax=Pigmentibacter sp. JX0631 TaxID=2976982 RepID=UPI0024688084|nr:acyl-CoA dehydrogenase family protein [Pigmentibacter sp. JX0631]WGL61195.1 acyl-CoA/acyl-ACP dehydrogenase [Pigmentibacter sp. JX0631]